MRQHLRCLLCTLSLAIAAGLGGCGSGLLVPSYTGGGLPPGDIDLGGVVLADAASQAADAVEAATPVVGAEVVLYRGRHEVGRTMTGPGGYFRFENPATGAYAVEVTPPAGSGLMQARRQFRHRAGHQTFLTITLPRS